MITIGLLAALVAAALVAALLVFPRRASLAAWFAWVAWLPLGALAIQAALWKPVLAKLSYFAVVPPLLTCVASLLLAIMGATLAITARERNESTARLWRATLIAAIPGLLLLALVLYSFTRAVYSLSR